MWVRVDKMGAVATRVLRLEGLDAVQHPSGRPLDAAPWFFGVAEPYAPRKATRLSEVLVLHASVLSGAGGAAGVCRLSSRPLALVRDVV